MTPKETELIEALKLLLMEYIAHNYGCADPECPCDRWQDHKETVKRVMSLIDRAEKGDM
jgi:hypothetical protein